jgi:putative DNA topoisomerase
MVIRAGRFGEYLACSMYPDHKETRPLLAATGGVPSGDGPGGEGQGEPEVAGVGETCPKCGASEGGVLVARRGRFGVFAGCSRYPACDYIHRTGPPPPDQLPFTVACPTCRQGHLVARRARRTGSVFYGCSRYPKCRFTTSTEPVGALHDADDGPVGRRADGDALCLACGAAIELPEPLTVGAKLPGGPPNPGALRSGRRGGPSGSGARTGGRAKGASSRRSGARSSRRSRPDSAGSGAGSEDDGPDR